LPDRDSGPGAGPTSDVNVFSGIVATIVVVLAHPHLPGAVEAAPQPPGHASLQDARLPAADRHLDGPGGHRLRSAHRPGLGSSWFGADFIPENWTYAERYTYLWTELIPVLVFIVVGVFFWWLGRRTRMHSGPPAVPEPVAPA